MITSYEDFRFIKIYESIIKRLDWLQYGWISERLVYSMLNIFVHALICISSISICQLTNSLSVYNNQNLYAPLPLEIDHNHHRI